MSTFGQQLRLYRRRSHDPLRAGLLTQERFGALIGEHLGDAGYSGAAVSDWERDKSQIHKDDRPVLVALLNVLHDCGGLETTAEADALLMAGNYRRLDEGEAARIFGSAPTLVAATPPARPAAAASRARRRALVLAEKVRSFWVEGVLESALAGAPLLTLSLRPQPDAIDHPWRGTLGPAFLNYASGQTAEITALFASADRALLLLGPPGSGKTMTLIALARGLLDSVWQDEHAPIPVILNLSTWAEQRVAVDEWVIEELISKYQIPRELGREWIAGDDLVLLLDGLDELPDLQRSACIKALNHFRQDHGLSGIAIASRTAAYLDTGPRLQLCAAVELQPLTHEQVDFYLVSQAQIPAAVRGAVRQDQVLQELSASPLMLNVMTAVYTQPESGVRENCLPTADATAEGTVERLLTTYVQRMFTRRAVGDPAAEGAMNRRLAWLARQMQAHNQSIFLIELIQPSWLPSRGWRWVYLLVSGLLTGFAGGLIMWLLLQLLRASLPQMGAGLSTIVSRWLGVPQGPAEFLTLLLTNLLLGLVVVVLLGLLYERREAARPILGSPRRRRWEQTVLIGAATGFLTFIVVWRASEPLLALGWGIAEAFMYMAAARFVFGWSYRAEVRPVEALGWSWRRAVQGVALGLLLAAVAELIEWLLYGYNGVLRTVLILVVSGFLLGGLTGRRTTAMTRPNQGIWLSARNAGYAAVCAAVPVALLALIIRSPAYALNISALIAIIAFALYGGSMLTKHFLLRGLLLYSDGLPWRLIGFLDYAAHLAFLRKVGGGYIFMHRLLQEHFARQERRSAPANGAGPSPKPAHTPPTIAALPRSDRPS